MRKSTELSCPRCKLHLKFNGFLVDAARSEQTSRKWKRRAEVAPGVVQDGTGADFEAEDGRSRADLLPVEGSEPQS